ncbi:MAG TPA: helix-turn-helix transcriptional regulator [Polyangia bacterium]|jgi:transcriptional regulator with XRE-family HTH domain|nr:helix-turn-helix transcriptional regulator [Polyangia bacterium]
MQALLSSRPPAHEIRLYDPRIPHRSAKTRSDQGAHLADLRRAAGLTHVELAKLVGETQQNITFWEHTDKPPRSDVLPKLAKILGVSVEQLLGNSPSPIAAQAPSERLSAPSSRSLARCALSRTRSSRSFQPIVHQYKRKAS